MRHGRLRLLPISLILSLLPHLSHSITITSSPSSLNSQHFDYVIVGGGTAGLTVASRLGLAGYSVAIIEAGGTGEEVMDRILAPAMAYYNGIVFPGSEYDWGYYTGNQSSLAGRKIFWPRVSWVY